MSDKTACGYCNQELPAFAKRCPRCEHEVGDGRAQSNSPSSTVMEQVGDATAAEQIGASGSGSGVSDSAVVPFRPVSRPRRAVLCVVDDGASSGELIRIRTDRLSAGRAEGDIVIPDDSKMSGKHFEVYRKMVGGYSRWFLKDLESTNGTFAKVGSAKLVNGSELIIGLRRFQFELPEADDSASSPPMVTQGWAVGGGPQQEQPKLIEIAPEGEALVFELSSDRIVLGSAADCDAVISDDPTVDPKHCEFAVDDTGQWKLNALPSLNGTWFRIEEIKVDKVCEFQAGEQRFTLKVL